MRQIVLMILVLLLSAPAVWAESQIDVREYGVVKLNSSPSQVATSADGRRFYVLTEQGEIYLYASSGQLLGSVDVGPDITGMTALGTNNLVLIDSKEKAFRVVSLEPVMPISSEGAPVLGPEDAPVTIAVFDDFQCPYCAKAVPLIKEVLSAYPKEVKLVFKHFPLSMHQYARVAAIASMAADRQGKFWPYHDLLFANYNKLNPQLINQLAEQVGLDMTRFAADQKDPQLQQKLTADEQEGRRIGVRGTPAIYVNGRQLQERSRAALDRLIQAELAKVGQDK